VVYFIARSYSIEKSTDSFSTDVEMQAKIDLLKEKALQQDSFKIFPFNPNFISDYKGYTLGMSVAEIDRLHSFRAKNEYVNSPEDFRKVTQISDSLLNVISPYFKFPEWAKSKKQYIEKSKYSKKERNNSSTYESLEGGKTAEFEIKDINAVSAEELKRIRGIGDVLSARILKFRNRLGGFLIDEQLYDVYGLEPSVAKNVLVRYKVFNKPVVEKININTASADAIGALVYIKSDVAREIVSFREANGPFSSLNELKNIEDFPADKIDRIALYLSL